MTNNRRSASTAARQGRLSARPQPDTPKTEATPIIETLLVDGARSALLSIPAGYRPDRPAPLLVLLHGAGGNAQQALGWLQESADEAGIILLAPQSGRPTWDAILRDLGPDVTRIDGALAEVFRRFAVDPAGVAIGGFSDGASYALTLGIANGDLFRRIVAFSPGFMAPPRSEGRPRVFISHGIRDDVLPIGPCSRRLVPTLRNAGYDVTYREFGDGHTIPPDIIREALGWMRAPA